jgi:hypothetical protein
MLAFTPGFALGADAAMMTMIWSKLIVASVPEAALEAPFRAARLPQRREGRILRNDLRTTGSEKGLS